MRDVVEQVCVINISLASREFFVSDRIKSDVGHRLQMAGDPLGLYLLPSSGDQRMNLSH